MEYNAEDTQIYENPNFNKFASNSEYQDNELFMKLDSDYEKIKRLYDEVQRLTEDYEYNIRKLEAKLDYLEDRLYENDTPSNVIRNDIRRTQNSINEYEQKLSELLEKHGDEIVLFNKKLDAQDRRQFARMTTLKSFKDRNTPIANKVFEDKNLAYNISEYLGGKYTKKNRMRNKRRRQTKRRNSRRRHI